MDFLKLIETAQTVSRNPRLNSDTINNATVAGMELKRSRNGKVFLFVDLYIDESTAKAANAQAHTVGSVVTESVTMTDDWGPGKAKEIILAALGVDEKQLQPGQLAQLLEIVPRQGELAPKGRNATRGARVRVEMVPYKTKAGVERAVSRFSNIPTTPDQLKASADRLTAAGVK